VHGHLAQTGEVPFGLRLRAAEDELGLDAVSLRELARVLDDDPDAAGQLQIVDDEGDPQGYRRRFASWPSSEMM
jgi:hypothetical protein